MYVAMRILGDTDHDWVAQLWIDLSYAEWSMHDEFYRSARRLYVAGARTS